MIRISRSATILINNNPDQVFNLFSPLGEKKWVPGWNPNFIHPVDGNWQEGLVFSTPAGNNKEDCYHWIVSRLNRQQKKVMYTVFTSNRIWTITVRCQDHGTRQTSTTVTYTYTALNELGVDLNKTAMSKMFDRDLQDWQETLNSYLENSGKGI